MHRWFPLSLLSRRRSSSDIDAANPTLQNAAPTTTSSSPLPGTSPQIVVVGATVMDTLLKMPAWPQPDGAVQGVFVQTPGGKGLNQAVACARLIAEKGKKVALVSVVADDELGNRLCSVLDEHEGIDARIIKVKASSGIHTDVTTVLVADGPPGYVGCRSASNELTAEVVGEYARLIMDAQVVCVTCDVPLDAVRAVVKLATDNHKYIVLNAAPPPDTVTDLDFFDGVDYLVLSDSEARKWLHVADELPSKGAGPVTRDMLSRLLATHGPLSIVITSGSRGCVVRRGGLTETVERHGAFQVDEKDIAGASDAFCAALAVSFLEKRQDLDRIRFASAAAALACAVEGAYGSMPHRADVDDFLRNRDDELLTRPKLQSTVNEYG